MAVEWISVDGVRIRMEGPQSSIDSGLRSVHSVDPPDIVASELRRFGLDVEVIV